MCVPLCCLRSVCMSSAPLALCVAFVLLLKCCFIFLCRFLFLYANMPYVFITHAHIYIYTVLCEFVFFLPSLLGNFRGAVFDYEPRCCCYGLCDRWERLILPTLRFFLCTFCRALCNHLAANFKSGSGAPREWEEKVLNIIENIFGILGIPQIFKTHLKLDDIS